MKQLFFVLLTFGALSSFAESNHKITGMKCKLQFQTAIYKKNVLGLEKKKSTQNVQLDDFRLPIKIRNDGAVSSNEIKFVEDKMSLGTNIKTKLDPVSNTAFIKMKFSVKNSVILRSDYYLGEQNSEKPLYERAETIVLESPIVLKKEGRSKLVLESVFYSCKLQMVFVP